jgi:hypothetical protein
MSKNNDETEIVYNVSDFDIDIDSIKPDNVFYISNEKNNNISTN